MCYIVTWSNSLWWNIAFVDGKDKHNIEIMASNRSMHSRAYLAVFRQQVQTMHKKPLLYRKESILEYIGI